MKQKTKEAIEEALLFAVSIAALASPLWLQFFLPV